MQKKKKSLLAMLTIADEEHFRSKKNYCCNAFL